MPESPPAVALAKAGSISFLLLRPGPKAPRREKCSEDRRQKIKENKRWNERDLFAQIFAERVLDRQCPGRNFEDEKNDDGHRESRNPSELQLITKKITDRRAESATNNHRDEKQY